LLIPVTINDYYVKWVNETFEWMRTVRKAWESKTLPKKNYRSNSKICKTCPLAKVCASAGEGDIKINSMEPLDETLSMV
jgi:CRISPR/Cas system-associated exonuclease Cas4 (RecB family)